MGGEEGGRGLKGCRGTGAAGRGEHRGGEVKGYRGREAKGYRGGRGEGIQGRKGRRDTGAKARRGRRAWEEEAPSRSSHHQQKATAAHSWTK